MSALGSMVTGSDNHVLVVHLPTRVTDEWISQIRNEVETRLPPLRGAGLVLDFENVSLINSLGITCLLNLEELCKKRGAGMRLANVPPVIHEFLKRVKLHNRYPSSPSIDEAVATFRFD